MKEIYTAICSGQTDKAKLSIQKVLQGDRAYIPAQLSLLHLNEGQQEVMPLVGKADLDLKHISHANRVLIAEALLISRSKDLIKIKKVLAFNSDDQTIEAYRKFTDGLVDIMLEQSKQGLEKMKDSIDKLSFIDPVMLSVFLGEALTVSYPKSFFKKYLKLIEQVPTGDPTKYDLLAFGDLINSDSYNSELINDYAKKSYDVCPTDPSISLGYAITLYHSAKLLLAKDILLDLVAKNNFYPPLADLYLALIFADIKEKDLAQNYLTKAKDSLVYFRNNNKKIIFNMDSNLNPRNGYFLIYVDFFIRYGIVFIVTIALILVVVFKRKK